MLLGRIVYFWMGVPPDRDNIPLIRWLAFRDELAAVTLVVLALMVTLALLWYRSAALRKKLRTPADVFGPYTPMIRLLITLVAGVVLAAYYGVRYDQEFHGAVVSWVQGSFSVGVWTALWTLFIAYILICLPGITPAKFKYRPYGLLFKHKV